jgi:hypothetical protein
VEGMLYGVHLVGDFPTALCNSTLIANIPKDSMWQCVSNMHIPFNTEIQFVKISFSEITR